MKNKLLLGTMLLGVASIFTACSDDNGSNPTLIQPSSFTLNEPEYKNQVIDLNTSNELKFTWSQPQYTADNAPINITYEVQVSPTGKFTVSTTDAEAVDTLVADYAAIDKTSTTCVTYVNAGDIDKALMKVAKWAENEVPEVTDAYVRVLAFFQEGTQRLNPIASNSVKINVIPYYIELRDADPIMWYLVGNNIADGGWSDKPGISSIPFFFKPGYTYDKVTGTGEIQYLNYFNTEGFKIQPADFNWDYGFMSGGSAGTAAYRAGGGDAGNIWCEEGYYLVTINTADNSCTFTKQDITPKVYSDMAIIGFKGDWDNDIQMLPANKSGENHVWYQTLTLDPGQTSEFKFRTGGSWDINWGYGATAGDIVRCGKCENGAANLGLGEGTWIILFNDINGEFSIIQKDYSKNVIR